MSKFQSNVLGKRGCGGGIATLRSLLTLKKGTKTSNLQSNEPSTNLIRPGILYAPGYSLQHLPSGSRGLF